MACPKKCATSWLEIMSAQRKVKAKYPIPLQLTMVACFWYLRVHDHPCQPQVKGCFDNATACKQGNCSCCHLRAKFRGLDVSDTRGNTRGTPKRRLLKRRLRCTERGDQTSEPSSSPYGCSFQSGTLWWTSFRWGCMSTNHFGGESLL